MSNPAFSPAGTLYQQHCIAVFVTERSSEDQRLSYSASYTVAPDDGSPPWQAFPAEVFGNAAAAEGHAMKLAMLSIDLEIVAHSQGVPSPAPDHPVINTSRAAAPPALERRSDWPPLADESRPAELLRTGPTHGD